MAEKEATTIAVSLNDRHGRRVVFLLNNDQCCVVASWTEANVNIVHDVEMTNTTLYKLLTAQ